MIQALKVCPVCVLCILDGATVKYIDDCSGAWPVQVPIHKQCAGDVYKLDPARYPIAGAIPVSVERGWQDDPKNYATSGA